MLRPSLPNGFTFGVGSSAFQVEGARAVDGRGRSVWDTFAETEGRVADGSIPDVSGQYDRVEEDLELLRELGVDSYRFSLSWARILPEGRGRVNQLGIDYYDRLIDGLLEAGIDPMVTLHHWDLPQALEDDGGWLNRATVDAMAEFAAVAGEHFADRVGSWVPISEPNVVAMLGYGIGDHAPGRRLFFDAFPAAHHLLLAHGRAAIELRDAGAAKIGCSNNHAPMWPATDDEADVGVTKLFDSIWNGLFVESMLLGRYPADLAGVMDEVVHEGDMATIRQPLDFYGVNYYSPIRVAAADEGAEIPFRLVPVLGRPRTASGWSVVPHALREWLILIRARFRAALPPLVITESGSSWADQVGADGVVRDEARSAYLEAHLDAVAEAAARGVAIEGYYAWAFLDGWEWSAGYTTPYGLVHVDPTTGDRTPKDSFRTYAKRIAEHRAGIARSFPDPRGSEGS